MTEGFIRVAVSTPEIRVADVSFNRESVLGEMRAAEAEHARLVVFPELVITAYTCADLFHQNILIRKAHEALDQIMLDSKEMHLLAVIGVPYFLEGKLYNTAAVIYRGRLLALIPKRNLPNYSEFYERRWFTPGTAETRMISYQDSAAGCTYEVPFGTKTLVSASDFPGFVLAAELCEDVWVPAPPSTRHALAGATIIANCSASDETVGKDGYRRQLIAATSARLVAAYLYANAGEGESSQDLVFGGQDLIAENGTVLTESERFRTGTYYADIDLDRLLQERSRLTTYPDASDAADEYEHVQFCFGNPERTSGSMPHRQEKEPEAVSSGQECRDDLRRFVDPHPFVPSSEEERAKRCNEIFTIQALGLKKRLSHIGCTHAVIGISGGLDSTLAMLVAARAFDMLTIPRENILAVTMPCFGTTDRTYNNAVLLTAKLRAGLREINIRGSVMKHFEDIGHDPEDHSVTYENSQARERTQILMDLANQVNGIVIGTGDLSELALGWATYNGDHMSMYAVNVGVPKTLVRHLVKFSADSCDDQELSSCLYDILDTPVSPELLPPSEGGRFSQKTEDLVGPYELHDFFLYQILRYGFSPRKVYALALHAFGEENRKAYAGEAGSYDPETILKWLRKFYWRFFSQQFKRSCLPDGPKVGSIAVSPRGDLRMPSDAAAAVWVKELETL